MTTGHAKKPGRLATTPASIHLRKSGQAVADSAFGLSLFFTG